MIVYEHGAIRKRDLLILHVDMKYLELPVYVCMYVFMYVCIIYTRT